MDSRPLGCFEGPRGAFDIPGSAARQRRLRQITKRLLHGARDRVLDADRAAVERLHVAPHLDSGEVDLDGCNVLDADLGADEADRLRDQLQQDARPARLDRSGSLRRIVLRLPHEAAPHQLRDDASGRGAVEAHLARQVRPTQPAMPKQRLQSRGDVILTNPARRTCELRDFVQDLSPMGGRPEAPARRSGRLPVRAAKRWRGGVAPPRNGFR